MKFDCGPTYQEKQAARAERERLECVRLENWHPYFAICRTVAAHDCRVLEWIERRRITHYRDRRFTGLHPYSSLTFYTYEYRARP